MLILGAGLFIYAQVAGFDFVYYDDDEYIFNNPQVQRGLTAENIVWAFHSLVSKHWHPVTWLSHMLDVQLFGLNPAGHHLMSLGLHLLTVLLLFRFLLITTGDRIPALIASLLLAVHPLHVENVAWVADRKDLLCALFWMVTLNAYAGYVQNSGFLRYMAVLLAFCLAALSKSMALTLPLVLILLDVWPLQRYTPGHRSKTSDSGGNDRHVFGWLLAEKMPFLVISTAVGLVTLHALNAFKGRSIPSFVPAIDMRVSQGISAYLEYLIHLVYPVNLISPYQVSIQTYYWKPVVSSFVVLFITVAAIRLYRRHAYLAVGWAWYLVTLLPVAGFHGPIRIADRYAYLTLIGIYIILAWGGAAVSRLQPHLQKPLLILSGIFIGILAVLAYHQTFYWKNTLSLFQHTLAVDPSIALAHSNLGVYHQDYGQIDTAIRYQSEAIRLAPSRPEYRYNLGVHYLHKQDYRLAKQYFEQANELRPGDLAALSNLGLCQLQLGEFEPARRSLEQALQIEPYHLHSYNHLGRYYLLTGNRSAAEAIFRRILRAFPDNGDALANLAGTLASGGAYLEAENYFRKAIAAKPVRPGYYFGLAALLTRQKKFSEAASLREKGLVKEPRNARQHYYVAVDYFFSNDIRNAEKHLAKAKELKFPGVESMFEQNLIRARANISKRLVEGN